MEPNRTPLATWTRRLLTALVVAIVVYLAWAIWDYEALIDWMARARPLPFFVATAALPALGIPFTPFYLLAGATFNLQLALVGTLIALAVNLTFCYYVGASGLRPRLMRLFKRFGYELPDFDRSTSGDTSLRAALRFTLLVKLTPGVPGFVKNYGLGAARVPFAMYFVTGMIASGVYAALLIVFGDSMFNHDIGRGTIALLLIAAAVLVFRWWMRRQDRNEPALAAA